MNKEYVEEVYVCDYCGEELWEEPNYGDLICINKECDEGE